MRSIRSRTGAAGATPVSASTAATVGLLALSTDANIEDDLRGLLPGDVVLRTTRISNEDPIRAESLRATKARIAGAAGTLVSGRRIDVLVYGCTSGAVLIGDEEVARQLRTADPRAACLTPAGAVRAALGALGARRLSILTPYVTHLNELVAGHFARTGSVVVNAVGLGLERDAEMTGLAPSAIARAAVQACDPSADALLVLCTSLRVTGVIDQIEAAVRRPVVTSNQALAWRISWLLEHPLRTSGPGRLATCGTGG